MIIFVEEAISRKSTGHRYDDPTNTLQKMKDSEKADRNVDARAIIEAVLKHVGMRAPTFAKAIGINYQRIFDLQSGRTKKFNPGVVNLIVKRFPDIDKMYLYTGEGCITLPGSTEDNSSAGGAMSAAQLAEAMTMQRKMLEMLQTLAEKEARLNERERELNDRETELDKREHELERILSENGLEKDSLRLQA